VNEFRVTKYDPALRDERGAFTGKEWTSFRDVGCSFDGVALTQEEYEKVESAYVNVALSFLEEGGVTTLRVASLESHRVKNLDFKEGEVQSLDRVREVIPRLLRAEFWCRLQGVEGFVHIGWDYYMFVGVPHPCPAARALAINLGLYVEDFLSPYSSLD
jgi:hypothetical protein